MGAVPLRVVRPRIVAMCRLLGREDLGYAVVHDHDGEALEVAELLCGCRVEMVEDILDAVALSEPSREWDLALISDRLPVVTRHEQVGDRAAMGIVDIQHHDHALLRRLAEFVESPFEVGDSLRVQVERGLAVVFGHYCDDFGGHRVVQDQLAINLANDCAPGTRTDAENLSVKQIFQILDCGHDPFAALLVAQMQDMRPSAAVVPVDSRVRLLGDCFHPTLDGVRSAVDDTDDLAVRVDLLFTGWQCWAACCHLGSPHLVAVNDRLEFLTRVLKNNK